MSIGSLGGTPLGASAAGSQYAQSSGSDVDRNAQESAGQVRKVQSELKAEKAAGIGETESENQQPNDRDADGRRPWEFRRHGQEDDADAQSREKDTTGEVGNLLDLSG